MGKAQTVTAKTVFDFAIGRMENQPDILILNLRLAAFDIPPLALDRRTSERPSKGLAEVAKKLAPPRHEN
jgi:hypothetical protein